MKKMMMVAVVVAGMAWSALAVPMSITYQGVLSEVKDGVVVNMAGTSATLDVRLWPVATGGTALWGRRIPVTLDHGAFNMVLSDSVGSPLIVSTLESVIQNAASELYIGLTVMNGSEITPRQRLLSAAYAVAAKSAEKSASHFAVNGNLTVAGSTVLTGATTLNGLFTTTGGYWMNGGATVQNNMFLLKPTAPLKVEGSTTLNTLAVSGAATLNGATTVNGVFTTSGGCFIDGGAEVRNSTLLLNSTSDLQVEGKFMRTHILTTPAPGNGFGNLLFGTPEIPNAKTARQSLILCITGSNTHVNPQAIAIYFYNVDNSTYYIAAQTYIYPNCQASLTVPIPQGQKFYMTRSNGLVTAYCGYVTTFANASSWAWIWLP